MNSLFVVDGMLEDDVARAVVGVWVCSVASVAGCEGVAERVVGVVGRCFTIGRRGVCCTVVGE